MNIRGQMSIHKCSCSSCHTAYLCIFSVLLTSCLQINLKTIYAASTSGYQNVWSFVLDMVSAHTIISTQPSRLLSGSKLDFVSKAGKRSKVLKRCHLDCPQRVPLPVQFLLFKIIAAFTTTLHL